MRFPLIAQPDRISPIRRIETFLFRARVSKPVVSTMASIGQRVALLVRIEDEEGCHGWGEVYSTLPAYGAEHRARVVHQTFAPLLQGLSPAQPAEVWQALSRKTHVMSIQTGEPGPLSSALGGLDCALWDLAARRAGTPICDLLSGTRARRIPVYASGLNPADGAEVVQVSRAQGFRAFKQKIGFGAQSDIDLLGRIRADMQPGESLMVDVNQGWTLEQALDMAPRLTPFDLAWVEEPLAADRPDAEWRQCAQAMRAPLAGGENLRADDFERHGAWLGVVQPDVGKWGGLSAGFAVAQRALERGRVFCPHWLGAGIGLMASAHLLAAVGGPGMLELDVNENPLREALCQPFPEVVEGGWLLTEQPGLGVEPDLQAAKDWFIQHEETVA